MILKDKLMKKNCEFFRKAAEVAGILEEKKSTVKDAIGLKALARLSTNKIRDLCVCLTKLGCNFWPSESKMRLAESLETRHVVGESVVESGVMALKPMATSENTEMLPYIRVTNLVQFITRVLDDLPGKKDPLMFDNKIWIVFSGDKGGGNVKIHIEILNSRNCGSVDNVHLYCMFEGADTLEDMWKVLGIFREQISAFQNEDFNIKGRKVKAFLGGDFHFTDDMLGHQGSASTFPSSLDLVTLEHLRNHGGNPHTPLTCNVELRTVDDYQLNYNENLCDDRCNGNMKENGNYHNSVVEQMLFPIKDLKFVVPPCSSYSTWNNTSLI